MIGLIGAMTVEVELIKGSMTEKREETISGINFVQGKLEGVDCVAAVSGIGKVNAAMCAQTMILRYHPRLIINTGVAGGMGKGIKISDGWKLRVDMTARSGLYIPSQEFVLIVTIKDPGENDIYSEIVTELRNNGYITNNLETRYQARQRR